MNPLVSIVIPCFNGADFVGDAIESALNQTYPHREVIVVDDGSTDDSLDVIRSYGDRLRWDSGSNRGGCAARNRGVELAQGEVIQFLDADDILAPQKLERQVPRLVAGESDVVYCNVSLVDATTNESLDVYSPNQTESFARCCLDIIPILAPVHWKQNLQHIGGFDESLPCSQERDLHLRMACHGLQFQHLPEVLATVRRREGSVSSDYRRVMRVRRDIVQRAVEILKRREAGSERHLRFLAGMLARDARAFLVMGEREEARQSFEAARTIHPEGGLDTAYTPSARWIRQLVGPVWAESVIQWRRRRSQLH